MARTKACESLHKLMPVLHQTLIGLGVLPKCQWTSVSEFRATFSDVDTILIDVTERAYRRETSDAAQREKYSEKKERHVKNTIISTKDKVIQFVGTTCCGRDHDYTMLKTELPNDKPWFSDIEVVVDLGYQGIATDYQGEGIRIPHKKPRKSKANPNSKLTERQIAENRVLSKIRIIVEKTICGIKRYNILNHRYRNRTANFDDDVIGICAGLWNFLLSFYRLNYFGTILILQNDYYTSG